MTGIFLALAMPRDGLLTQPSVFCSLIRATDTTAASMFKVRGDGRVIIPKNGFEVTGGSKLTGPMVVRMIALL